MEIKVGDLEILKSGTIVTIGLQPVSFKLAADFTVKIHFINEGDKTLNSMKFNIDGQILNITLVNFISSLGTANTKLLPLGTIDGKKISLNIVVYALNEDFNRVVHYTFFQEGVNNG